MDVLHCPNPACPYRARFGYPAEFQETAERCSDCGADLKGGAGSFDPGSIAGIESPDALCARPPATDPTLLGPATDDPIRLGEPPGRAAGPIVLLAAAVTTWLVALLDVGRWGHPHTIASIVAGFVFVLGVKALRIRLRDRAERWVEPHREGFVLRLGGQALVFPHRDIRLAELRSEAYRMRMVKLGTFETLLLETGAGRTAIVNFRPTSAAGPVAGSFGTWAEKLVEATLKR